MWSIELCKELFAPHLNCHVLPYTVNEQNVLLVFSKKTTLFAAQPKGPRYMLSLYTNAARSILMHLLEMYCKHINLDSDSTFLYFGTVKVQGTGSLSRPDKVLY